MITLPNVKSILGSLVIYWYDVFLNDQCVLLALLSIKYVVKSKLQDEQTCCAALTMTESIYS